MADRETACIGCGGIPFQGEPCCMCGGRGEAPLTDRERRLLDALAKTVQRRLEDQLHDLVVGTTSSTRAAPGATLTAAKVHQDMRRWADMIREGRRGNVTMVVVDGHTGPPQITRHPTEGAFVECSFAQALEVNRVTPLRLVNVVSVDRAHFEVATAFGVFCPLIPPPYEVPDGE